MNYLTTVISAVSSSPISGNYPLTLTLCTSGIDTSDATIADIVIDFGDNSEPVEIKRRLSSPGLSSYFYPSDEGDPRNVLVTHVYDSIGATNPYPYTITLTVTKVNNFNPVNYIKVLNLNQISSVNNSSGYFEDLHLIRSRIYGAQDEKMLVFETVNPNYLTHLTHFN